MMKILPRTIAAGLLTAALVAVLGAAQPPAEAKAKKKKAKAEPPDTVAMFKKLDTNSDGKLDLDEFKQLFTAMPKPKAKKGKDAAPIDLEFVFKSLDANSDKALSPDEFKGVIPAVNPPKK